jgi:lysophospholipase L1-like esterase
MSGTLGCSRLALGRQHIIALASMLALAACGDAPPINPTANAQYLTDEANDDLEGAAGDEGTDRSPDTVARGTSAYSQYIAFGDSFTSGFGLVDVATKCIQSPRAWPPQVNTLLGIASPLVFAACSGANTQDIVAYGPLVKAKKQAGPQIALLPPPEELDSALITIQIGGNDLRLDDSVKQCLAGLNALSSSSLTRPFTTLSLLSPQCASLDLLLSALSDAAAESILPSLDYTFRSLREAAPNATIVAVGYPHLVNATSACAGVWSAVPEDYRQRLNDVADAINAKIARAAENAGIFSITDDVVAAFTDREACSPRELISRVTMHPNAAGHQAIARVVANGVSATP